jgi:hypothetical protein
MPDTNNDDKLKTIIEPLLDAQYLIWDFFFYFFIFILF